MQTESFVLCNNLFKIYKVADLEVVALQGLNLELAQGEMMALVGPSGVGKSTLLNVVGGLDRPSAGAVRVAGWDLLRMKDRERVEYKRQAVGFVWQQPARNLLPYLSAQENVELPMTVSGMSRREKRAWTRELLDAVGLYDRRRHRLMQLSGGQQQRVGIAVALANKPALLLGDEPTGEVDSATAQTIMDPFHRLGETLGLTTIIVTHDPRIARQVDRVVAIRDGKTSTETIRRVAQLERAMIGERPPEQEGEVAETPEPGEQVESVTYHEYVVLDSAGRLQVPQEYRDQFGIGDRAQLEMVEGGVLIRPIDATEPGAGATARPGLEEQIARLFADEKPPERKGLLTRLKRRRGKEE